MVDASTTALIEAGYMGILDVAGKKIRVTSFNVNVDQSPLFYDHTVGLRDTVPVALIPDANSGKKDVKYDNKPQKNLYRPGVVGISGSTSFPLQDGSEGIFFDLATKADDFTMTFARSCTQAVEYSFCKVSQYQLDISAGDIASASVSIMSLGVTEKAGFAAQTSTSKLVSWDACSVSVPGLSSDAIVSFSMTITNDCKYLYTAKENYTRKLGPSKIRVGLQSVTGSISFYKAGLSVEYMTTTASGEKKMVISAGAFTTNLNCILTPVKRDGQPGPIISTLAFHGVGAFWDP